MAFGSLLRATFLLPFFLLGGALFFFPSTGNTGILDWFCCCRRDDSHHKTRPTPQTPLLGHTGSTAVSRTRSPEAKALIQARGRLKILLEEQHLLTPAHIRKEETPPEFEISEGQVYVGITPENNLMGVGGRQTRLTEWDKVADKNSLPQTLGTALSGRPHCSEIGKVLSALFQETPQGTPLQYSTFKTTEYLTFAIKTVDSDLLPWTFYMQVSLLDLVPLE